MEFLYTISLQTGVEWFLRPLHILWTLDAWFATFLPLRLEVMHAHAPWDGQDPRRWDEALGEMLRVGERH